jgi:CheY-like chemotaxis protein
MTRILVVDDEPHLRRALVLTLTNRQYQVTAATTAAAALDEVARFVPDLVVLDLGLPDRDGVDVVRDLQRDHPEIPIVVLSARTGSHDKVLALDLGAVDYVTKSADAPRRGRHRLVPGADGRGFHRHRPDAAGTDRRRFASAALGSVRKRHGPDVGEHVVGRQRTAPAGPDQPAVPEVTLGMSSISSPQCHRRCRMRMDAAGISAGRVAQAAREVLRR